MTCRATVEDIPARILWEQPRLLKCIQSAEHPGDETQDWNARLDALRRVVRLLRDEWHFQYSEIREQLHQCWLDPLVQPTSAWARALRPILDLAVTIEDQVVFLPQNHLPLWVIDVPLSALYSLVHHALTSPDVNAHGKSRRTATYSLVGAYLWWHTFASKTQPQQTRWTALPRHLYAAAGFPQAHLQETSGTTLRDHCRDAFGIQITDRKVHVGSPEYASDGWITWIRLHWNSQLPTTTITARDLARIQEQRRVHPLPPLAMSEAMRQQLWWHQFYYPTTTYQQPHPECPLLLWNTRDHVTVPLVPGIVPILLATLIPTAVLTTWAQAGGVPRPKNSVLRTLRTQATEALTTLAARLDYPSPDHMATQRHPRWHVAEYLVAQHAIMQAGLPVDPDRLDQIYQGLSSHVQANLQRSYADIRRNVQRNDGLYQGVHRLASKSERTYTRRGNLQGFPGAFKPAVRVPATHRLLALDVMSNDVSLLFNLSGDPDGLARLRDPFTPLPSQVDTPDPITWDPYYDIAAEAFPGEALTPDHRDQVKAVVNPWLYGASARSIHRDTGLARATVTTIRDAIQATFPTACQWLDDLATAVRRTQTIPAHLNPVDGTPIPMPAVFARRVAPIFLIQRLGASLLKLAVVRLTIATQDPLQILGTVHDSILALTTEASAPVAHAALRNALHVALQDPLHAAVQVLTVRIGVGQDWASADAAAAPWVISAGAPPRNQWLTTHNP